MRRAWRDVSRWGFAIAVAAGLSFGAQSVVAAPAGFCEWNPDRGSPGISCRVQADCAGVCWYGGMWVDGMCNPGGCCDCPF